MLCRKCGAENDPNVYHCAYCGEVLEDVKQFRSAGADAGPSAEPLQSEHAPAKPDNWLVPAIAVAVLCPFCLPLSVAAIVCAAMVDGKYNAGDYEGAERVAGMAKLFTILAALISLMFFVFVFVGAFFSSGGGSPG